MGRGLEYAKRSLEGGPQLPQITAFTKVTGSADRQSPGTVLLLYRDGASSADLKHSVHTIGFGVHRLTCYACGARNSVQLHRQSVSICVNLCSLRRRHRRA